MHTQRSLPLTDLSLSLGGGGRFFSRVLGYRAWEAPETGVDDLLIFHETGRLTLEGGLPAARALDQGRLYTDGAGFYLERKGRYRALPL